MEIRCHGCDNATMVICFIAYETGDIQNFVAHIHGVVSL